MYHFNCIIILINVNFAFLIYVIEEIHVVLEKKSNANWAEHEIFTTEIIFPKYIIHRFEKYMTRKLNG